MVVPVVTPKNGWLMTLTNPCWKSFPTLRQLCFLAQRLQGFGIHPALHSPHPNGSSHLVAHAGYHRERWQSWLLNMKGPMVLWVSMSGEEESRKSHLRLVCTTHWWFWGRFTRKFYHITKSPGHQFVGKVSKRMHSTSAVLFCYKAETKCSMLPSNSRKYLQ